MKHLRSCLLILVASSVSPTASFADTLIVESVASGQSIPQPRRGEEMQQVVNRFGEPSQRSGPVGDPPISTWSYPDFVVYFENQTVIHSVAPPR